ncbi:HAD family phosphatase [Salibacterium salarium]|uniref:HAD family phosphatase n=1 Tax=Salibacterium salarium TaxID=284579 RepID=A0A3R9PBU0_9BACI|nr:Cof-type HAD-IIB family hydrolase [Salibacterium salarium]RSL34972.1 HAD family phosphatase [Salibacterium salarium]
MNTVAIDMDGTLLHTDGYVSKKNADALRRLQNEGHNVVIATGRGVNDVERLLKNADLTPDGIVALNGSIVSWQGERIREMYMDSNDAVQLATWLDNNEYYYHINTGDGVYSPPRSREFFMNDLEIYTQDKEKGEEMKEAIRRRADGHRRQAQMKELTSPSLITENNITVYKFLIISMLEPKLKSCVKYWGDYNNILVTSSGRDNLEIMHPETQKGKGLLHLLNHADLDVESTFAIGDNFNDLPLFNVAATSIAMGNAEEDVKRLSTRETLSHDDDGVAYAIDSFILDPSYSK